MIELFLLFLLLLLITFVHSLQSVSIDFNSTVFISQTVLTLQVVANPLLDPRTCSLAKPAWQLLRELVDAGARLVRYVPWYTYPKVAVAELNPPDRRRRQSFWNFTDINAQLDEFLNATASGTTVINFSTQPAWFYDGNWSYPADPNVLDYTYSDGTIKYSNTTQNLADYYGRLLSWLVKGSFKDEFGHTIGGGPAIGNRLTHWEIFNEIESEHSTPPETYNEEYDAIVTSIRKAVDPQHRIQFVGLALDTFADSDYVTSFLNASNHAAGIPLDYFSFHLYSIADNRTDPRAWQDMIRKQIDFDTPYVAALFALRDAMNPMVKISLDEIGTLLPDDNGDLPPPPVEYYKASAAQFAYAFVRFAELGLDILGMSQLVGTPPIKSCQIPDGNSPSTSMFDWRTGKGNARADLLKLMLQHIGVGSKFVRTRSTSGPVVVNGFISANDGKRKAILINTSRNVATVAIEHRKIVLSPFDTLIETF